ncbi:hypothetical protein [Cysteiniphilum marinum]|uniref:hypothetical protein n=1 Tax=Cysteiniphilum marinum TaxID=2774191 RepID=UPI00193BA08C|nr:hypothetical protein [Cysteiniphilum marinum]
MIRIQQRSKLKTDKQQGFILASLMVALMLISGLSMMWFTRSANEQRKQAAQMLGNKVAEYHAAVLARLSDDKTLVTGTYKGLDWLKSSGECGAGTAPKNYLPCSFHLASSLLVNEVVTEVESVDDDRKVAKSYIGSIVERVNNKPEPSLYLGALVHNTAQARYGAQQQAVYNGKIGYSFDADSAMIIAEMIVSRTYGKWLKLDGTNLMQADISFDGKLPDSERNIQSVSNIHFDNSTNALISNTKGGVKISSNKAFNVDAQDMLHRANSNYQLEVGNKAYVSADKEITMTVNGMHVTLSKDKLIADVDSTEIKTQRTDINTNGGHVYLGNQSGTSGEANVTVNDMIIKSLGGKKLSEILSSMDIKNGDCSSCQKLNFSITTGAKGMADIMVYGGSRAVYGSGSIHLVLALNGSILKDYSIGMNEHEGTYAIANPMFKYQFEGGQPYQTYTGFSIEDRGWGNRDPQYLGYTVIPM